MFTIELRDKVALVTGAGRGIGRAIASALSQAGAALVLNDLDEQLVLQTVDSLGGPSRAIAVPGDVTAKDFADRFTAAALEKFGSIDIVVNNAGYTWDNVIQKMSDEQFQTMLDVHLIGPFRILRAASGFIRDAAKREIAEGKRVMRKVVNITSIAGTDGNAGQAAYSSAKAGVVGLTKTMAKEWGRYSVNVNAVGFGLIETRLTQPLTGEAAQVDIKGQKINVGVQPKVLENIKASCPLGRLGTPEEAAGPVLFFCSPLSDYITGEVLICGGGLHF
ncbi:MAG TPA: SDR family oxidoreductase [Bryobacteraceae bacterium]|nr:SDR family oxidoreductase [Bryobacteraceae bacterium]